MESKQLEYPCDICLVRACCSEVCEMVTGYMLEVLNLVADNPNHEVLKQFSELQADLVRSVAVILKRNKDENK